jgi:hypothetical protein
MGLPLYRLKDIRNCSLDDAKQNNTNGNQLSLKLKEYTSTIMC